MINVEQSVGEFILTKMKDFEGQEVIIYLNHDELQDRFIMDSITNKLAIPVPSLKSVTWDIVAAIDTGEGEEVRGRQEIVSQDAFQLVNIKPEDREAAVDYLELTREERDRILDVDRLVAVKTRVDALGKQIEQISSGVVKLTAERDRLLQLISVHNK